MTQPRVGVVGSGRVGTVLAARFLRAGHPVTGVSGRSTVSLTRRAALIPEVPLRTGAQIAEDCDVLVLAVPDDALAELAVELSPHVRPGQIVAHTSGRHGRTVLAPFAARGARTMALHPAMTFTGTELDLGRSCVFGVTALPADRDVAETIVTALGGSLILVAEDDRPRYHAALAHGANHLTTLVNQSLDLMRGIGVDDPAAVLRPLLEAALTNTLSFGDDALTGPVVRGDVDTVRSHLDVIDDPVTRDTYAALARATVDRARSTGRIDASTAASLDDALTREVAR